MTTTVNSGDRIIFTTDICQVATSDTPDFLLARKGDTAIIVDKSKWATREYLVRPENGRLPFYTYDHEFNVIKP